MMHIDVVLLLVFPRVGTRRQICDFLGLFLLRLCLFESETELDSPL